MWFIDIKRRLPALCLAFAQAGALAANAPLPRFLQEPVVGLRLPLANAGLDALPDSVRSLCEQLADNENWKGRLWIYATAKDAGSIYYIVGGYYERPHPAKTEPKYYLDETGAVFRIQGKQCLTIGGGREVFEARYLTETPQAVLAMLAADLAVRLVRAFGSADQLRMEMHNQRIDTAALPIEVRAAFKDYFPRADTAP